ncbi:MAG: hypothetical protein QM535_18390 [Limnohabitans sp.]|nr:hypothetical protein [Limnohabitans sp.]
MGFFSSLFSSNDDTKESKKNRIEHIKNTIENHKRCIDNEKKNMARYRAAKAASHNQEGGKRNIAHYQRLIASCREEIKKLRG